MSSVVPVKALTMKTRHIIFFKNELPQIYNNSFEIDPSQELTTIVVVAPNSLFRFVNSKSLQATINTSSPYWEVRVRGSLLGTSPSNKDTFEKAVHD